MSLASAILLAAVTVATWNGEWFPSGRAEHRASPEKEERTIRRAGDMLRRALEKADPSGTNDIVLCLNEIRGRPEAEALCGARGDAATLARGVYERFGCATLVKGGHRDGGEEVVDVLYDGRGLHEFALPRVVDPISTHGTGCTLAAAIAAELALGHSIDQAVAGAKRHVHAAISNSYLVGRDCGVLGFASGERDDNDD